MSKTTGYTGTAKTLHWLILALLIVQFVVAWTMPDIKRDTKPDTLINLHLSVGVLILAVAVVRLAWRADPWRAGAARRRAALAGAIRPHHPLAALSAAVRVPVLGWINASWRGFPVIMFGFELPKLVGTRVPGWGWTGDVHGILAEYALLVLVGLHVAAALYHYFIRRDGVLQRMLPGMSYS